MRRAVVAFVLGLVAVGCSGDDDTRPAVTTVAAETVRDAGSAADTSVAPSAAPGTEPVQSTAPGTRPVPSTAPDTVPAREYDFAAVGALIDEFVAEQGINGAALVVVERDDGIVFEHYAGAFTPDRVSFIASSSKMLTAGVLMYLAERGLLDPDQPIAEYVPWAAGHNPQVTVAQMVSNSSGLVGLMPEPGYAPYVCQFVAEAELEDCATQIWTTPADDGDIVAPDTEYRYGGAQWQVAGAVAETVSGKTWAELVEEVYVEPCGLTTLGYSNHWVALGGGGFAYPAGFEGDVELIPDTENPHMEGGAYTNARDYAEVLLMHLRDGWCGDTQVFQPETLERMHSDYIGPAYGGTTPTGSGYGFGWWTYPDAGRIDDPGAYGATAWLDLDDGYGAFLLVEQVSGLPAQLYDPVEAAIQAARG